MIDSRQTLENPESGNADQRQPTLRIAGSGRRWLLAFLCAIILFGLCWFWMRRLAPREQHLVGVWSMTRTQTDASGKDVTVDIYMHFTPDRRLEWWWMRRDLQQVSSGWFGTWHVDKNMNLHLKGRGDLINHILGRYNDPVHPVTLLDADHFSWKNLGNDEHFVRIEDFPPEIQVIRRNNGF